jgi:hypothetical protein
MRMPKSKVMIENNKLAYIQSCIPNATRYFKLRYFVVIEEIMIPNPNERAARIKIRTGSNKAYKFGTIGKPVATKLM